MSTTFHIHSQTPLTILDVLTILGDHKLATVGIWKAPGLDESRYPPMTVITVEFRTKEGMDVALADRCMHDRATGCRFYDHVWNLP